MRPMHLTAAERNLSHLVNAFAMGTKTAAYYAAMIRAAEKALDWRERDRLVAEAHAMHRGLA